MSNVLISVVSEFDKKGFKQADGGLKALTKGVAKFAGSLALAHKAQKAMFDFMADEKSSKILAQNLKNLGLGFATKSSEEFISTLQKQTGILDDQLRPAYAQLARVTGSVAKTQELMALAFDVSAGTGTDYGQVIDALSQAYVGNNKGLRSLNIGLSTADLKTKSFADIVEILNKQFKGSGEASLDSYAGKMALLQVAASDASETIGKSLLDAITTASGPNGFPQFIKNIQGVTNLIVDLVTGTSRLIALFDLVGSPSKGPADILKKYRALRAQWEREDLAVQKERSGIANNYSSYQAKAAALALAQLKTSKTTLITEKKITDQKKAQIQIDKANALIAKAKEKFDLEGIQLAAALANEKISIEERKRLEVLQATWSLEQAIAQGDEARIAAATALLEKLLGQYNVLDAQRQAILDMYKLFEQLGVNRQLIDLLNLEDAFNLINQMAILGKLTLPDNFPKPTSTMVTAEEAAAALAAATTPEAMAWDAHERAITANRASFAATAFPTATPTPAPIINVNVEGAIDPEGTARTIVDVLSRSYGRGALPAELLIL